MRMPWSGDKENKETRERQNIIDLLFTRAKMHWWLLGVISALAVMWIAFPMEEQRKPLDADDFRLDKKSPRDVFAQLDVVYYDDATAEEKRKTATEMPPVFSLDFQRLEDAKEEFSIVHEMRAVKTSLDLRFQPVLDSRDITTELRQKLEDRRVLLSQDASVAIKEKDKEWLINSGSGKTYIVKKEEDKLNVYLTDEEKVRGMKRRFIIGPTNEVGLILATTSNEELEDMEKEVMQVLSSILASGVIPLGGDGGSFTADLSKIDYMKPKWEQIRKKLEQKMNRTPTKIEITAEMDVTLVDTRSEPVEAKIVPVTELLFWPKATSAARGMSEEMPLSIKVVVEEMCVYLMRPNLKYDPILTEKRRADLLNDFPPVRRTISKGNKIVGIGDTITEPIKEKLEAMSHAQRQALLLAVPGAALLVALFVGAFIIYLKKYEPSIFSQPRKIMALNIAILLTLVLGNLIIISGPALKIERPGFLIPAALASIVVAMLANVQLAIVVTCILGGFVAMLAGIDLASSLEYFLVIMAGGTAAAISASRARHRRHLMVTGVYVSIVSVVAILGLGLLKNEPFGRLGTNCLLGATNGVMVAVLAPGLMPIFEYLSRTTTDMELLELADLNQPLLVEFKGKAAGTYYHSLDIAKLAETAAEEIGANPLLTRVGSYYHDIGKMTKPENFIENQKGENIHDSLTPRMSARIIVQHVKEGSRLAREHKLPQIVIDMIEQHHGTTMIGGQRFYQKALEADKHNTVRIEDYRYPGPKPQTKEAAILQLADSVESARRVLLNDSPAYPRLVSFAREIVEEKIMDFQLDECDLTLRDIRSITNAFVKVLSGIYHTRIEYSQA